MPVRSLQSLCVAERGVSFQDWRFLAIGTSREDDLCNDVSQDGVIVCHSSSTLYMMSYITVLQALRRPIRLLCKIDVIHRNNGDQES